ncbi:DUF2059 domain-containing protein [Sphingomonas sp.]|uniref:DUF2059 domain-containing protein n=1 Tax=Sphingomonas sp. TaxID=28214 RepID=UPI002CD010DD|nr:DUF2059 domain-containing protein [Sphingomonas sp.]HWK35215.1 DUF2059 domain-containing protein [Sphingomonas sp.]
MMTAALALLLAAATPGAVQDAPPPAATTAAPAGPALAAELVGLLGIDQQLDLTFTSIMPLMTENIAAAIANSGAASVELRASLASEAGRAHIKGVIAEEVMLGFRDRYPRVATELAKAYAERFTEAELRDLVAFYRSPAGAKLLKLQPELQQTLSKVGERIGLEVGMEAIPKAIEKLEGAPPQPESPRT